MYKARRYVFKQTVTDSTKGNIWIFFLVFCTLHNSFWAYGLIEQSATLSWQKAVPQFHRMINLTGWQRLDGRQTEMDTITSSSQHPSNKQSTEAYLNLPTRNFQFTVLAQLLPRGRRVSDCYRLHNRLWPLVFLPELTYIWLRGRLRHGEDL